MGYVFISYSHKDKTYVHRLQKALRDEGFNVWIDDRVDYGKVWPAVIQEHLDASDALILVMTPRSYKSIWVQNELERARRKRKPIFTLLLEGDVWLSVQTLQYADLRGGKQLPKDFFEQLAGVTRRYRSTLPLLKPRSSPLNTADPLSNAEPNRSKTRIIHPIRKLLPIVGSTLVIISIILLIANFYANFYSFLPRQPAPTLEQIRSIGTPAPTVPHASIVYIKGTPGFVIHAKVISSGLNCRETPLSTSAIVYGFRQDDVLTVVARDYTVNWLLVYAGTSLDQCWVSARYVEASPDKLLTLPIALNH